jgi:hypothetical protein
VFIYTRRMHFYTVNTSYALPPHIYLYNQVLVACMSGDHVLLRDSGTYEHYFHNAAKRF